ncbi:MAG: UDP-N-acetylmuramate dehydrogenase [Clostridia bacterium]|nr:UDP-N-acetylmuramate dehydrogenase [Clostridia bacterium]
MDKQKILQDLRKIIPKDNIKIDEPMSKHTSFKTGGPAEFYITAKTIEDIQNIFQYAKTNKIKLYIIGNGSNLLVSDEGIKGIVLKIVLDNIDILESDFGVLVKAGAGVKVMSLAQELKKRGITGFEELAGIPGTIGGANYMNAGAYGKEIKDIIVETKVLNKETGNIEILKNKQQHLEYRNSVFKKNNYIILETTIQLRNGNTAEIEQKMNEYLKQRKEKQPTEFPSAGSTFKRVDGFITAKLIDECGLKGYQIGGAQISEKHAGFIINKGNATSKDILDLIAYTKKKVFEKFGVQIEEEVEII